jgi:hypothetical protein
LSVSITCIAFPNTRERKVLNRPLTTGKCFLELLKRTNQKKVKDIARELIALYAKDRNRKVSVTVQTAFCNRNWKLLSSMKTHRIKSKPQLMPNRIWKAVAQWIDLFAAT